MHTLNSGAVSFSGAPRSQAPGRRLGLVAVLALVLSACAAPKQFVAPNAPLGDIDVQRIYLATDRVVAPDLSGTTQRGGALSFAQFDITIPPGHQPGEVEFSAGNPDPTRFFTVADARPVETLTEIGDLVRSEAGSSGRPADSTIIYVHGFSTSLEAAVYRHAQIAHDYELFGPQVTFSWPSIQRTVGYVRDKDSVLIARDHLEELIAELTRQGDPVFIFGHSMGTQLVVETLRQLSISGRQDVLSLVGGVILISPDIDLDLFESQYARIDPRPYPFVVMTSERDYALRASAILTAQPARLGSARDRERLAELGLLVVDLSGLPNARDHFLAANSPIVIDLIKSVRA
jgi:esterase/lipase superfamily enzyme